MLQNKKKIKKFKKRCLISRRLRTAQKSKSEGTSVHLEVFSLIDFMLKWTERCKATVLSMATVRDGIYTFAVEQKMKQDRNAQPCTIWVVSL